ncbi:DUF4251 domain-containing protein [Parabacteroides bouchesdurhonensis]|uniref:DUF4251 domain-containing protein n=1 Tax=Parabacteroides bouchesdurhonensis TaxID=1936995 RepID=UPI000E47B8E1|nr:DUF4251 domain-containing protein [Parabacteroides bouchesdurhonensis]RHJ93508.1 DUF4251 domain-containing protein [Bacteroides sp. AM07-16]
MKNIRLFFLWGIVLFVGGQSLFAQTKKEKRAQKELQVKEVVNNGQFTIDVNRAIPMNGRSINLTSSYSLELRGDSVFSYLPYFGQAYSVPYGGGNGLRFKEPVKEYDLSYTKKGVARIKFHVRANEDNYTFNVQIFPNGSATIGIVPVNKQSITFYGEIATGKGE